MAKCVSKIVKVKRINDPAKIKAKTIVSLFDLGGSMSPSPRSSLIPMFNALHSFGRYSVAGKLAPVSHLLISLLETLSFSASSV